MVSKFLDIIFRYWESLGIRIIGNKVVREREFRNGNLF